MKKNTRFEGCYEEFGNFIFRIAMKNTSDYYTAQDIEQQVFCEFYAKIEKINLGAEKAWLLRSTRNAIIDFWRKNNRRGVAYVDFAIAEEGNLLVDECLMQLEDQIVAQELTQRIFEAVKKKNVLWYEALVLCCVKNLSYKEAAEILDVSEIVLRSRVCRARAFIRENFWNEYKNE
ncbi:MAG: sigma-70 family RNA polymerase sigma factor [Lachnospiraceae bacterium]|nr:sigma-70 family RNA polymerase sigma factor [Lachnospiraceae bacterium]